MKIDDALRYDSGKNRVHCDLVLHCLTTRSVNTLFKYIDDEYSEGEDYSITICDVFKNPQRKFICIDDVCGESVASSIDINFCPICGRKLQ